MSGYGGPDDEAERARIRVEEQVALARSQLPYGIGSPCCVNCYQVIPEARREAMPGTCLCVFCQEREEHNKPTFKNPWAT